MALETTPLFIPGGLGGPEIVLIFLVVVLLFGANKIPKIARSTGEAMGEFQKGREQVEQELQEMRDGKIVETEPTETTTTTTETVTETEPASESSSESTEEVETETEKSSEN
jgi:sec-independent protein translocase protein TatA